MSFSANVLQVMIASPSDVEEERNIVTERIHRWNSTNAASRRIVLLPVKWETHSTPELGAPPQTIINRELLEDADIVIGIFATRIGTPTEEHASGTVEEIKRHVAAGKTAKVYFSDVPKPPSTVDQPQYASVVKFREEIQSDGIYARYSSIDEFKEEFRNHLDIELNKARYRFLPPPESSKGLTAVKLSDDALHMLESMRSNDGILVSTNSEITAGTETFSDGTNRTLARWKAARNELLTAELIATRNSYQYEVTDEGYKFEPRATTRFNVDSHETAFDRTKREHTLQEINKLPVLQRDLVRLLLVKGGSAQANVIVKAYSGMNNLNLNFEAVALLNNGFIERTVDSQMGTNTLSVTPGMKLVLEELLFPRDSLDRGSTTYFNGLPG